MFKPASSAVICAIAKHQVSFRESKWLDQSPNVCYDKAVLLQLLLLSTRIISLSLLLPTISHSFVSILVFRKN